MTNCNKNLCDSTCPSVCKLDRFKYDSDGKCRPAIWWSRDKKTNVLLPASRGFAFTREELFLLCNYGECKVAERLKTGEEYLIFGDYTIFEGDSMSQTIDHYRKCWEAGATHCIFCDSYLACSHENDDLLGRRTVWCITPYHHYRLFEDGCITSEGKWLWGYPDLVQFEYQLAEYDEDLETRSELREESDLITSSLISSKVVAHCKGDRVRSSAALAMLVERLRGVISINLLDQYIDTICDRKGVLQVNIRIDCPHVVTDTLTSIWDEEFCEPLVEIEVTAADIWS